jgi:putative transposase
MRRKIRVEYPGAIYHIMSRGDRRENIFLDDVDRQDFIKTLAETCQKTGFQVHAYCLMSNHYHLVVETPNANLVAGMAWLQSTYTIRLNHRHKLFGHVFSGRYKSLLVDGSGTGYLKSACDYVHLNPVRAGLLKPEDRLMAYPWSSFGFYLAARQHRPGWLRVDRLLGEHGIQQDTALARQEFECVWKLAAQSKQTKNRCRLFGAAGVWEVQSSRRGCWSAWKASFVNTIPERCGWRRRKPKQSGYCARRCFGMAGIPGNCNFGPRTIRRSSP